MQSTTQRPTRGRDIHEAHRVATSLELLFDLTFVVAIALASAQLHHGVLEHHLAQALAGYVLAFLAIWWAWMNYTWFASAYDNDDLWFRLLTMVQMGGVLVLATGVPGLFAGDFLAALVGYIIMRLALGIQWLRAAVGDPARRASCLRYAMGIGVVQLAWIGFVVLLRLGVLSQSSVWPALVALWLAELVVPVWAERASGTPWHAHHIAERYGLLIIIVLGECVLGATNAMAGMWQSDGWSFDLALVGFANTVLIFSLWWIYFLLPSAEALHHHRERAVGWGYGHFFAFASVAAVGSGLEVVADVLKNAHADSAASQIAETAAHGVSPLYAIGMVALAQALFMVSVWALHWYAARSLAHQSGMLALYLGCVALGPLAVWLGAPLPWGLLLLSVGPMIAIAYNEHGKRHCETHFAVR